MTKKRDELEERNSSLQQDKEEREEDNKKLKETMEEMKAGLNTIKEDSRNKEEQYQTQVTDIINNFVIVLLPTMHTERGLASAVRSTPT
jgi:t-SNARE complex subunit (syntaxin)